MRCHGSTLLLVSTRLQAESRSGWARRGRAPHGRARTQALSSGVVLRLSRIFLRARRRTGSGRGPGSAT
ncbi:hypothetical protein HMPREF9005_2261 [Actinomyces sp. oral taxon 178 str. F0338]|nr:hypothetical protein HMPREF9005_2261 [Actinomyces sp. oral taxon 178 str. F0338]